MNIFVRAHQLILATALMLWSVLGLAATPLIGVSIAEFDDNFRNLIRQHIQEYGQQLDVDMVIENASSDPELQLRQVRNYIRTKVDAIIVLPVTSENGLKALKLADEAGIPIVFANANPGPERWPSKSAYVGSKEVDAGTMEMEQLAKLAGYKGKVVILEGEKSHSATVGRTEAVNAVVKKYPDLQVVKQASGNWQSSEAANLILQWLKEGVDFNIIAANNDSMAIGAVLGLEKAGKDAKPYFIGGVDGTQEALQSMAEGKLDTSVLQDAGGQARKSVDLALQLIRGEAVGGTEYWIPFQLITPENRSQFQ